MSSKESFGSAKINKGAIIAIKSDRRGRLTIDPKTPPLIFQYNPEKLTRIFCNPDSETSTERVQGDNSVIQLIHTVLEFDDCDELAQKSDLSEENGLHPVLATLEKIIEADSQKQVIIFSWGTNRTLPVKIVDTRIVEEAFDSKLNPIRVRIELTMKVKNPKDLGKESAGHSIYMQHLNKRDTFAQLYNNKINKKNIEGFQKGVTRKARSEKL